MEDDDVSNVPASNLLLQSLMKNDVDKNASDMCRLFYQNVDKHTGLQVNASIARFRLIHQHVYPIVLVEENEIVPVSFVHSSRSESYCCSDLITSAIMDMKPKPGVCFSPCDTGIALSGTSRRMKTLTKTEQSEFFTMMKKSFSVNVTGNSSDIHTDIVPLNLRNEHWGVLMGTRFQDVNGKKVENPTVYFGDSLRFKCPRLILELFKKAFVYSILGGRGRVIISSKNVVLDVKKYFRQADGYSCGCYVISFFSEFASDRGCAPDKKFAQGYSAELCELYRWMSIRSRLLQVLMAVDFFNTERVTETMVSVYRVQHRDHMFEASFRSFSRMRGILSQISQEDRNLKPESKLTISEFKANTEKRRESNDFEGTDEDGFERSEPVGDAGDSTKVESIECRSSRAGSSTHEVDSDEEDFEKPYESYIEKRKEKLLRRKALLERVELLNRGLSTVPMYRVPRKVRFEDSYNAAFFIVQDLLQTVMLKTDKCSVRFPNEVEHLDDLVEILRELATSDGWMYGVHYFRTVCRRVKGNDRAATGRMRCVNSKCTSSICFNLIRRTGKWEVVYDLKHRHESISRIEKKIEKRMEIVRRSLISRCKAWRKDGKTGMTAADWNSLERSVLPRGDSHSSNRPLGSNIERFERDSDQSYFQADLRNWKVSTIPLKRHHLSRIDGLHPSSEQVIPLQNAAVHSMLGISDGREDDSV